MRLRNRQLCGLYQRLAIRTTREPLNVTVGAALARSMDLVNEGGFFQHLALSAIVFALTVATFVIPIIGPVVAGLLLPFALSIVVAALEQMEGEPQA